MDALIGREMDENFGSVDPWREVLATMAAFRSGCQYGVKIRFPHALVMTFMFRRDLSTRDKLITIARAVFEHAKSLGSFAFLYKSTLVLLKVIHRKFGHLFPRDGFVKLLGRFIVNTFGM